MQHPCPILLIDDDPSVLEILKRAAVRVFPQAVLIGVGSGEAALAYLEDPAHEVPSLILLDINLQSDESGLDLLPQLRQHPRGKQIPVAVLTEYGNPARTELAMREGAAVFTDKPESLMSWQVYLEALANYWCSRTNS